VIACSALKRPYRDILVHGRKDVRIIYLQGTQDLIASRLAQRKNHFMPPGLLVSQFKTLELPDAKPDQDCKGDECGQQQAEPSAAAAAAIATAAVPERF